jgi:hypothetical protein
LGGGEPDLRERMRAGARGALRRAGGAGNLSGLSLVAALCAAALTPVVTAGVPAGPVLVAGISLAGSVGAGVLADVVRGAADWLRDAGGEVSPAAVEAELAGRLEKVLEDGGEPAAELRAALAGLLEGIGAVGAVVEEAAAREAGLLPAVAAGLAGLGEQFTEFAFAAADVREAVWAVGESLRQQQAEWRAGQERVRDQGLMLQRVLEAVERDAGTPAGPGVPAGGTWQGCPYPGLLPFGEQDAQVFYGRADLASQLVQRLGERMAGGGILLVTGASGAGKTSLLRAGVLPRLAAGSLGPGSAAWPRRVVRPAGTPLRALAATLADLAGTDAVSAYRSLLAAPQEAPLLASQAVRAAASPGGDRRPGHAARLVLVIDQFEELFTAAECAEAERAALVTALDGMASVPAGPETSPTALVVVAVRADFLDRLAGYPPLAAALAAGPFTVGPMTEAELRLAITGPAAEAGLMVEDGLADAVIGELRGDEAGAGLFSGVLPLASQAMAATWEHREGGRLTVRGYRRAGGAADAVNQSARDALRELTAAQQDAARVVFTQLTTVTPGGQLARRRCGPASLPAPGTADADIAAVIRVFAARRLLVMGEGTVEISHDVLLHAWAQLRDWLGGDQLERALYSQVISDADAWEASARRPAYLYPAERLAAADAAAARRARIPGRYPPLPAAARAFLDAARQAARRAARRRRAVTCGLLALTLTAAGTAAIAATSTVRADQQHAIALSRQLAADSLGPVNPVTARQLAVAAWGVYPTSQASAAMAALLAGQQQDSILPADPAGVNGLAFSPDGKTLATAGASGTVRFWDPATGQPARAAIHAYPGATNGYGGVTQIAYGPDGKVLATAGPDGTVRLWEPGHRAAGRRALQRQSRSRRHVRGRVQPGRWDPRYRRRRRYGPVLGSCHRPGRRRAPPGRGRIRGDGAGVQPGREDPRHRGRRPSHPAVGPRHPPGRRRAPAHHRRQIRSVWTGVQPGREDPRGRQHLRNRPALEPGHQANRRSAPRCRTDRGARHGLQPRRENSRHRRRGRTHPVLEPVHHATHRFYGRGIPVSYCRSPVCGVQPRREDPRHRQHDQRLRPALESRDQAVTRRADQGRRRCRQRRYRGVGTGFQPSRHDARHRRRRRHRPALEPGHRPARGGAAARPGRRRLLHCRVQPGRPDPRGR